MSPSCLFELVFELVLSVLLDMDIMLVVMVKKLRDEAARLFMIL